MNKTLMRYAGLAAAGLVLLALAGVTGLVPGIGIGNDSASHSNLSQNSLSQNSATNTTLAPAGKRDLAVPVSVASGLLENVLPDSRVQLLRVPDGGIQPRAETDAKGTTHLLYFLPAQSPTTAAQAQSGHLYYRQLAAEAQQWSPAIQVSTAVYSHNDAIGKASLAIDTAGRVHVIWLELDPVSFRYTRSNLQHSAFESPRSMVSIHLLGIEAEPALAVSGTRVAITWHAGDMLDEAQRAVYARTSSDAGATFGPEQQISDPDLGACACCGLAATYRPDETLLVAYRSAIDSIGRHMQLLQSASNKRQTKMLDAWELNACPVTSNQFAQDFATLAALSPTQAQPLWLVFETRGEIRLYDDSGGQMRGVRPAAAGLRQKHPALAINTNGQRLLAWGEGNGYKSGGRLNWQLFNPAGATIDGTTEETTDSTSGIDTKPAKELQIPDYSVAAVAPRTNNSFVLIY